MAQTHEPKKFEAPPLTAEEREQVRLALVELSRLRAESLRERGGKLYPDSGKLLHRIRYGTDDATDGSGA